MHDKHNAYNGEKFRVCVCGVCLRCVSVVCVSGVCQWCVSVVCVCGVCLCGVCGVRLCGVCVVSKIFKKFVPKCLKNIFLKSIALFSCRDAKPFQLICELLF